MKHLKHYVNSPVPTAAALIQGDDAISFSVLTNIVQGDCAHTFTDHESVIVCHSTPPYPVWVWCRDPGCAEDVRVIAACIKEKFPTEQGYRWNMSCALFSALQTEDPYFADIPLDMGLLSYRMDELLPVTHPCEGYLEPAKVDDFDLLCKLWHDACLEMEGFDHNAEFCRSRVARHFEEKTLFTWRNTASEIVAMTSRGDAAPYSKIATVYTLPQHRRKGYAMNLVHAVSDGIRRDGLIPILYTDAGYAASNTCYQKIGFRQVDSLCTLGKK